MKKSTHQSGASILEFMVVLPILVTLAFTAIEFGAVFTRYNIVSKTVQDAARYLTKNKDASRTDIDNLIRYNSLTEQGGVLLPGGEISIFLDRSVPIAGAGEHVRVTATYNHTPAAGAALSNLVQFISGSPVNMDFTLTASSLMRYIE